MEKRENQNPTTALLLGQSVKGAGYSISQVENCSKSKSETTFTLKKTALIHESVSEIFF